MPERAHELPTMGKWASGNLLYDARLRIATEREHDYDQ